MNWRRTLAIAKAEWLLNRRDIRSMAVIFALPVILLILYGYGLNFELEHIRLAVQDLDRTELSREIIRRVYASGHFDIVRSVQRGEEIPQMLRRQEALVVLVIPPGLSPKVAARRQGVLQLAVDGADPTKADTALGYMNGLIARMNAEHSAGAGAATGVSTRPISVRLEVLYNPGLSSAAFIVPGLIGVVMALMTALLTSTCIVREREVGTIEALLVTPVRPADVIVGKLLPYGVLSVIDIVLCIAAGELIFDVYPQGSIPELMAYSMVYLLVCLNIGLLVSGRTSSQRTAIVIGLMALMLPTILLSGFVFPISSMPPLLRAIANLVPSTHYIVGARAVYLRGVSTLVFWPNALALVGMTAAIFVAAVRSFRAEL